MPSLICLSPTLADQAFPRHDYELRDAAIALGKLSELVEQRTVSILHTAVFDLLLADFNWEDNQGIRGDIFRHLHLWFLQGTAVQVTVDIGDAPFTNHPLPSGCVASNTAVDLWAEELGRLLVFHDSKLEDGSFCIGIACDQAFCDRPLGAYPPPIPPRAFPIVGPETSNFSHDDSPLVDAYHYPVPQAYAQAEVSFANAAANCRLLGATEVVRPTRGSHYRVKFPLSRPWVLDSNHDPCLDKYLRQLVDITGHPLPLIKFILIEGRFPPLEFRLA